VLCGVVTQISKKRDNKGNRFAFVQFEDLSGRFEVPLFNRYYQEYFDLVSGDLILGIVGTLSTYNNGMDEMVKMVRINPKRIFPIEELPKNVSGELHLNMPKEKMSQSFVDELKKCMDRSKGNFGIKMRFVGEKDEFTLHSERRFFPDNEFLGWLDKQKIKFSVAMGVNNENSY
jgi:DNA polymerase III alpha subunit